MRKEKKPVTEAGQKKKKKSGLTTWLLVLIMILGVGMIAYPTVSDKWNSYHASRAIASYSTAVESLDREQLDAMIADAKAYNRSLLQKINPYIMTPEELSQYNALLNLSGNGIMGYITIKSIGVYIPIYHGTEESVLQIAVGHIDWSSLPVGEEGTHAILSGHRGLPSAKLFTDLDQMKEGDRFSITVLNQEISYEVDQIRIVEPQDLSSLAIEPGKDYCTLVTCTPYGVNTHRLLIRGRRVATETGEMVVAPEAFRIPNYLSIPAVGIPVLFLFLIGMLIYYRSRRPKLKRADLYRMIAEVTEKVPEEKAGEAVSTEAENSPKEKPEEKTDEVPEADGAKENAGPGTAPDADEDKETRRDGP